MGSRAKWKSSPRKSPDSLSRHRVNGKKVYHQAVESYDVEDDVIGILKAKKAKKAKEEEVEFEEERDLDLGAVSEEEDFESIKEMKGMNALKAMTMNKRRKLYH